MNLDQLFQAFATNGCQKIVVKRLRTNDNSKQQVYFGGNFEVLNLLPVDNILPSNTGAKGAPIFKAALEFYWLYDDGTTIERAPGAQLILYPQYPEVRFSGFLTGTVSQRARIMVPREEGRILFMGVREDASERRILGYVSDVHESIANEFVHRFGTDPDTGVFRTLNLRRGDTKQQMLRDIAAIHKKGFIQGKRLDKHGSAVLCQAPNCGGYTLEAELGITPNGRSEPDYLGWEVKHYAVADFNKINGGRITLMTPEPTGGFYRSEGAKEFVKKYGTKSAKLADRMDFAGTHKFGETNARSGLVMDIHGYDVKAKKITDSNGYVALVDSAGVPAASWDFAGLMKHWNKKHNKAVYVPGIMNLDRGIRSYHFSNLIRTAEGTDFLRLLAGFASRAIYYDPGIKVENMSTSPKAHLRSQFRVSTKDLGLLYHNLSDVNLNRLP